MICPHCGHEAVREHGPDRFGFTWISCGVCGWHRWNTTLEQEEMNSVNMDLLNIDVSVLNEGVTA